MRTIYVVEDEEKLRKELCTILEKNGYKCIEAVSFDNVADDIVNACPDLILLDINLPVYDGFYICRELRRKTEDRKSVV